MYSEVETVWIGADSILYATAHRPWPLPDGQWAMTQTWHDLLFMHYPVSKELLRPLVPDPLTVDLYAGEAWISVTPFWMSNLRPPGVPPVPFVSRFAELNVRTYVTYGGKPGVYFFSLDAANFPAVWGARAFFYLPYFYAKMSVKVRNDLIIYNSSRRETAAELSAEYRPIKGVEPGTPGTLEHWLTERYCLYTVHRDQLFRAEVHHKPWPLQAAEATFETLTVADAVGLPSLESKPFLHFSREQEVIVWPLRRVAEQVPVTAPEIIGDRAWELNGAAPGA